MDALLSTTQTVPGSYPYWDFQSVNGIVPIIYGPEEMTQTASVITYTQKGIVPQAPVVGVNWTGLMTGSVNPTAIDTEILNGLTLAQLPYKPSYTFSKNSLVVNVVHQ